MRHPFFEIETPIVIGHRGCAGEVPENTLASFAAALEQGAQVLESDVQLSRDGIPILLHDAEVDRVSEGKGRAADLCWAEITALDAGHRFEEPGGGTPFRGRGLRIPSLEEAFERFPDARFNLEIKSPDRAAIRATLALIERFDRADRTLLAAGEDPIMRDLRRELMGHSIAPAVSASLEEIVLAVSSAVRGDAMPAGVMALQIPPQFGGQPLVTEALVEHAHRHDVQVHVWTINDLDQIAALLELGVDGVVTDHPGRMTEWLSRGD